MVAPFATGFAGTNHSADKLTISVDDVHQLSSHQPVVNDADSVPSELLAVPRAEP